MKKVYGMPGVASAQIVLTSRSGKTKYKIPFAGGITNSRERTPAKFITDSPIIQDVIESNEIFGKKVFLLNSYGAPSAPAAQPATVASVKDNKKTGGKKGGKATTTEAPETQEPENTTRVVEDVTTLGEAITVLMEAGAGGADVTSLEGVLAKAQELKISFPNLKTE